MPPFDGPRATLCVTRKPVKTSTEPSSIRTGTETSTAFLQLGEDVQHGVLEPGERRRAAELLAGHLPRVRWVNDSRVVRAVTAAE